jgi:hypothetical protein
MGLFPSRDVDVVDDSEPQFFKRGGGGGAVFRLLPELICGMKQFLNVPLCLAPFSEPHLK